MSGIDWEREMERFNDLWRQAIRMSGWPGAIYASGPVRDIAADARAACAAVYLPTALPRPRRGEPRMTSHVYDMTVSVVACQYDGTRDSLQPVLHMETSVEPFVSDAIAAGLLLPSNWLVLHPNTTVGICPDEDFQRRYRKRVSSGG